MKKFRDIVREEKENKKPIVMAFGRMNPPTVGHQKLVDKVKHEASKMGAEHHIVLSHSHDAKKNPLHPDVKVKHAQRAFPGTNISAASKEAPSILHHARKFNQAGHKHLVVVAGSDRVKEFHDLLHKYNGHPDHYHYDKIEVKSAGHRDPDAEGTEGMSASKMREHASNGRFHEFKKGVPTGMSHEHAKELYHDVRKGMGLHESHERGLRRAIFVVGGPGSGKDLLINNTINEQKAIEFDINQIYNLLCDKKKLSESYDSTILSFKRKYPIIISCSATEYDKIKYVKEEIEEFFYESMMIFVNTSDEASFDRNEKLTRRLDEAVRKDKWSKTQKMISIYCEMFDNFIEYDNSLNLDEMDHVSLCEKEIELMEVFELTNQFFDSSADRITEKVEKLKKRILKDNNSPVVQMIRKAGKIDDVRDGDVKSNSDYIFRTYEEKKYKNFQKDKKTTKTDNSSNSGFPKAINSPGVGPEYSTRGSGTVYPMSGLGNALYSETKVTPKSFKKFKEAIDDPGACDMGVSGGEYGATNKEPMQTMRDKINSYSPPSLKKKSSREKK